MAAYGCTITVATGKIPSSQSNFVWLATEVNFPTGAKDGGVNSIDNGGGNLRCYTDDTKVTQLPIEVVSFVTGGTPSIQVWGLSPTLNVASTVYIEADEVVTTQPSVTDTYGRNAVYVNRVSNYHLEDNVDSAGNNDLTSSTGTPSFSAGEIGDSLDLDGSSEIFGFFSGSTGTDITITAWIKPDDTTSSEYIFYGDGNATPKNINAIVKGFQSGYFNIFDNGYPTGNANDTRIAATAATWQKLTYTSNGTTLKGFKNGIEILSVSASMSISYARLFIGSSDGANFFNGLVDEAYLANEYRSVGYDLSEYNNQSDPSTFWTTSAWVEQGGGGISGVITEAGPSFTESISANLSVNIISNITESGPSFTESINATVFSFGAITADILEQGPSFTESISTNLDANIAATITELGPSFTDSINVSITKDITANVTEAGPSFVDSIIATVPIVITVNPKNLLRVKRKANTVRIQRKSNIIRIK